MNVTRSLPDCLEEYGVDEANDRRFVCGIEEVLRFIQFVSDLIQTLTRRDILHHLLGPCRACGLVIDSIQTGKERQTACEYRFDWKPEQKSKIVQCSCFHGISRRHKHRAILCLEREHMIAPRSEERRVGKEG